MSLRYRVSTLLSLASLSVALILGGCGGGSSNNGGGSTPTNPTTTPSNPTPTVSSLSPASATAGAAAQTLTITGTNFVSSSTVTYKGTAHTATFGSATSLTIPLTAADQAAAGTYPVVVTNPSPGGGSSTAVNFTVNNPKPTITSIAPATVVAGTGATTLTVTGTGFNSTTTVTFASAAATPTIGSATSLTIPLTAANLATAGSYAVVATNPAPGGGSSSAVNLVVTKPTFTISGTVYKGTSVGSTVTAYAVNSDGSKGASLGSATTDSTGAFKIVLSSNPTGPVRVTSSGGNYVSEWDNSTITGTSDISLLLDAVTANVTGIVITPASEFINSYATGLLSSGKDEPTAHTTAKAILTGYFGLTTTADVERLMPLFGTADVTAHPDAFTLGLDLAALAQEGSTAAPTSPDDLIAALSLDISDGTFDGKQNGTPVPFANGAVPTIRMRGVTPKATSTAVLSPTAGDNDFLLALGLYITKGHSITGAGITPTRVLTLQNNISAGVTRCPCVPATAVGLQATSAGATTTYSVGGQQYLIMAGRKQGVVVINITDPTKTSPAINAWPKISSTVFSGADVGGVGVITGLAGHPQVLAFAYVSKTIALLNLNTLISGNPATDNPVDLVANLELTNGIVGFSGGAAYIAGAIPDNSRGGFWLDTSDGYGLLALSSLPATYDATAPPSVSLSTTYAPDSGQEIAENFGGDITNNQLLGGNYQGIQVVELGKGKSYSAASSVLSSSNPGLSYSYFSFDGDSIDQKYRVGIMTYEDTPYAAFVNMATLKETDAPADSSTPNQLELDPKGIATVNLIGPTLSGSAVDPNSHLALFMAGFSNDFAVGQLQDPSSVAAGDTWKGLTDWSYFTINQSPELSDYFYAKDPHSVGVVVNQTTGTPYGYLLDATGNYGVVQIDMTNFLKMARAGASDDAAHRPSGDPGATKTDAGGLILQEFVLPPISSASPAEVSARAKSRAIQDEYPNQPIIVHDKQN